MCNLDQVFMDYGIFPSRQESDIPKQIPPKQHIQKEHGRSKNCRGRIWHSKHSRSLPEYISKVHYLPYLNLMQRNAWAKALAVSSQSLYYSAIRLLGILHTGLTPTSFCAWHVIYPMSTPFQKIVYSEFTSPKLCLLLTGSHPSFHLWNEFHFAEIYRSVNYVGSRSN